MSFLQWAERAPVDFKLKPQIAEVRNRNKKWLREQTAQAQNSAGAVEAVHFKCRARFIEIAQQSVVVKLSGGNRRMLDGRGWFASREHFLF